MIIIVIIIVIVTRTTVVVVDTIVIILYSNKSFIQFISTILHYINLLPKLSLSTIQYYTLTSKSSANHGIFS